MANMSPPRQASATALGVAAMRAVHQVHDERPHILDDPLSQRLLDPEVQAGLLADPDRKRDHPLARGLRSNVVVRSRYAEGHMDCAARRGVRQLVVLGAGFDTFAYRQPVWARDCWVFEIDHPASQAEKRTRLERAGISVPPNVALVGVDFELTSLAEGVSTSRFDLARPSVFSWLGVTMYLTRPAIDAVLTFVAHLPAGTELIFTYLPTAPEGDNPGVRALAQGVAALGEPWKTSFETEELRAHLREVGFTHVEMPSAAELAQRYFVGRADGLPPPRRGTLVRAVV
jgi:methyltransferase (TIGR00027 family)